MSIREDAMFLRLGYIYRNYEAMVREAEESGMSIMEFLEDALARECNQRRENGQKKRIQQARFPYRRYLVDFKTGHFKTEIASRIDRLRTLDFIGSNENVILIGNPGTGKTHLAIALGIEACMQGKTVLFASVPNLVIELKEAMSLNQLTTYKRRFERYDLVILDELGYISFDKEENEILFNLLSNRNATGSMIITTNLTFDRWEEVFKDPVLTGAIVDRLAHKAHVLDMTGDSYRIKETKEWMV